MAEGTWQGLRSTRLLAAEWGVSMHVVGDYSREASGVIRRVVQGNPDDLLAEILQGIESVKRTSLELVRPFRVSEDAYEDRSTPDCGAALRALELRAKLLGLMVDKHEVKVVDVPDGELETNCVEWLRARGWKCTEPGQKMS